MHKNQNNIFIKNQLKLIEFSYSLSIDMMVMLYFDQYTNCFVLFCFHKTYVCSGVNISRYTYAVNKPPCVFLVFMKNDCWLSCFNLFFFLSARYITVCEFINWKSLNYIKIDISSNELYASLHSLENSIFSELGIR